MTHIQSENAKPAATKKTTITYWLLTGLFAFVMLGSAIPDILVIPMAVQGFKEMGYPAYLVPFLGWAKLLGVVAILVPGFPRIREWAYAGLFFDLLGAAYSVANSGKTFGDWAPMLGFLALGAGSYIFYHKKQPVVALTPTEPTQGDFSTHPSVRSVA